MSWENILKRTTPQQVVRADEDNNRVWVIATPHFLDDWKLERYGKSKSKSIEELLGGWKGFGGQVYDNLLNAPIDEVMYAALKSKSKFKPLAHIYFRNRENENRSGRRELELISITPPDHGDTQGINYETLHDHALTEKWKTIVWV
jgi:hypothetical protein